MRVEDKLVITAADCEAYSIKPWKVPQLVKRGELDGHRVDGRWYVTEESARRKMMPPTPDPERPLTEDECLAIARRQLAAERGATSGG